VAALVLVGIATILANPRHRAFYLGWLGGRGEPVERPFRLPSPPVLGTATAPPEVSRVAALGRTRHPPLPDATGRIVIPLADRVPWRLPAEGRPAGWELHQFAGRASIELVRDDRRLALRLRSDRSSFVLYRDAIVDLAAHPYLVWWWKAVRLPPDGDVRARASDDQAAQVYVVFPRWPAPLEASDVVGYVWDSRAPVGTRLRSPKARNVRLLVVESGTAQLGTWQRQERNAHDDYVALFDRRPPRVGRVALMVDADDTRGVAEALFGDIAFARQPGENMETPTSMLR
jgi:hypothetical protein